MCRGFVTTAVMTVIAILLLLSLYTARDKVLHLIKEAHGKPFVDAMKVLSREIESRKPFDQILSVALDEALYFSLTMGGNLSAKDMIIPIRITPEVFTKYYVYCEDKKCEVYVANFSNFIERLSNLLESVYSLYYLKRTNPELYMKLYLSTAPLRPEAFRLISDAIFDWNLVEYRYRGPMLLIRGGIGRSSGNFYFFPLFTPRSKAPVGDIIVASRIYQNYSILYNTIKNAFNNLDVSEIYVPAVICKDTGNKPYPKYDWLTFLAWLIDIKCNKENIDCLKELTGYNISTLLKKMEDEGLIENICGQTVYNCSKNITKCLYDLNLIEVLKYWYYRALTRGIRDTSKVYYVCVKEKFDRNLYGLNALLENETNILSFFQKANSLGLKPKGEIVEVYSTLNECQRNCKSGDDEAIIPGGYCREYRFSKDSIINKLAIPLEINILELGYNWSSGV